MSDYECRTFEVPEQLEEQLTAALWAVGALGFEVQAATDGRLRLDAYFSVDEAGDLAGFDIASWESRGVEVGPVAALPASDWLADYRASASPFDIGRSFRVDPRDPSEASTSAATSSARHLLRIPAQTAFGTGSHESTRLVLEWLEDLDLESLTVLDVGVGSGILSLAALQLGARRVVGCDVDAQAVCVARANSLLNGQVLHLVAGGVSSLAAKPCFDLALVNILPENIMADIERLPGFLRPGAGLISSGNLVARRDELLPSWTRCGFELQAERQQDEWLAFLLRWPG